MRYICTSIVATLVLAGTVKSDSEQNGGYVHHSISIESLSLGEVVGGLALDLPRNRLVGSTQLAIENPNGIFTMNLDSGELQVVYQDDPQDGVSHSENYCALAINTETNTWYTWDDPWNADPGNEIIIIDGSNGEATRVELPSGPIMMGRPGSLHVDEVHNWVWVVCRKIGGPKLFGPVLRVLDGETKTFSSFELVLPNPGAANAGAPAYLAAFPTTDRLYIGIANQLTVVDTATNTILNHIEVSGSISGIDTDHGTHGGRIYVACSDPDPFSGGHATLYEMNAETLAINRTFTELPAISGEVFYNPHDDHIYVFAQNYDCGDQPSNPPSGGIAVVGFSNFHQIDWVPFGYSDPHLCGNGTSIYASWGPTPRHDSSGNCVNWTAFEEIDYKTVSCCVGSGCIELSTLQCDSAGGTVLVNCDSCEQIFAGDLDGDGDVDADDLTALHAATGICHSDVNHDGATDIDDLLILIEGWNSVCP